MIPFVIPGIILGISLLVLINRLGVEPSLFTVGLGHVMIAIPFSMMVMISRLEGLDRDLEEASMDLGEGAWSTFWRVTFPLALPGIVASLLLTFTLSFDEFLIAFFLTGKESTLPIFIFSQLRPLPEAAQRAGAGFLHPRRLHDSDRPGGIHSTAKSPRRAGKRIGRVMKKRDFIAVRDVTKHFGRVRALQSVDIEVNEGEFFALLGPLGMRQRPPCCGSSPASSRPRRERCSSTARRCRRCRRTAGR